MALTLDSLKTQIAAAFGCRPQADEALLLQAEAWARTNASTPNPDALSELHAFVKGLGWDSAFEARLIARLGNSLVASTTGQQDVPHPEN